MPDDPDTAGAMGTPAPLPAYPVSGADQAGYQPPYPSPPRGPRRTGLIITGVVALVVGVGIGVGATVIATNDDDPSAATTDTSRVPTTTPATSTTRTDGPGRQEPGDYSMSSVSSACDLIDPALLHKWGSTPREPLYGWENEPTDLGCQVSFIAFAADQTHYNEIGINFEARFTEAGAAPAYDEWKDEDTADTGAGLASGDVTGIGSQGYWHSESTEPDGDYGGGSYTVAVQDSNVSVRVRLSLLLQPGEPPANWEDLSATAKTQIQLALAGLQK